MVRPEQYASQVEALTGYRMTAHDYDLLQTDLFGIRTLAGGVDGLSVTKPAEAPTPTSVLAQERIAEAASWTVVGDDAAAVDAGETPRLFGQVDFTETLDSDPEVIRSQLETLHRQVLSHDPSNDADTEALEDSMILWSAIYDLTGDAQAAWAGVLSALLRDPDFLFY